jgi:pimeloyl-ACP methyl ester carboxylesterase
MVNQEFRKLYPFKDHFWDRQGLKLHYVDEGQGAPVVMVHGNPSWSFYYRGLIKELSQDHRVLVPDHIGMGLSDKPGAEAYDHTLKSRVDDLEGWLESLKVRKDITLVVHDWGGMIGMAWACRHLERIKRLIVLNTWAFEFPAGLKMPWQIALARTPLGPLAVQGFNAFCRGAATQCVTRRPLSREIMAAYLAPYDTWANRLAVLRFVQDIPVKLDDRAYELMKWTGANLHKLAEVPMLLAWGGKDFVFNDAFYNEWRRRFPKAQTLYLADAGHYVLEDAPEEIIPAARAFVQKNPLASAV